MEKKNNQPYIIPTKLWRRLDEIEQEVNLGTFDNVILASFFLMIAIAISVLLWSFSKFNDSVWFFVLAAILLLFLLYLSQLTLGWIDSTIFKNRRFRNKTIIITILLTFFLFLIILVFLPLGLEFIFPNLNQNSNTVLTSSFVIAFAVPTLFFLCTKPKITKYFVKNFPSLFLRVINKMNKEQRAKALKEINVTLSELKQFAKNY